MDLENNGPGTPSGNQVNVKLAAVLKGAITSFCAFNSFDHIPKNDSGLKKEATIRLEVQGPDQRRTVMKQYAELEDVLTRSEQRRVIWKSRKLETSCYFKQHGIFILRFQRCRRYFGG